MRRLGVLILIAFFIVFFFFGSNSVSAQICTEQYDPVCGVDGKTYSNSCYANSAKVEIDCEGTCPCESLPDGKCNVDKDCSDIICPQVVGGDTQKCDLTTNSCYCGGTCGDGYCDFIEKRDNLCGVDCEIVSPPPPPSEEAYFRFFDYFPYTYTAILKLTDPEKIQKARDILDGKEKVSTHIVGKIIKEPVSYNSPWSYHLNSSTVEFFENLEEVCDSGILFVENHLDEVCGALLPQCKWCPWGSGLLEEVNINERCSDSTLYGSCSFDRPLFCENGKLIDSENCKAKSKEIEKVNLTEGEAMEKAFESDKIQVTNSVELEEQDGKTVYVVEGTKRKRILFLFPVNVNVKITIDAQSGEIVKTKKPWWNFLAW